MKKGILLFLSVLVFTSILSISRNENRVEATTISYQDKVVQLVNVERKKKGLAPLKHTAIMKKVATAKAADMRDRKYFSHNSPKYGDPFKMMTTFGIKYRNAGENIAAGQRTPEQVVKAWMNSSGHRANILNKNFTEIGVGYVTGGKYGTYWVQSFRRP